MGGSFKLRHRLLTLRRRDLENVMLYSIFVLGAAMNVGAAAASCAGLDVDRKLIADVTLPSAMVLGIYVSVRNIVDIFGVIHRRPPGDDFVTV